jgi:glutamine amidotransferase PdxT
VNAVEHALSAVLAAHGGDVAEAAAHIAQAQQQTRATARRERQLVEIAALVVRGAHERAAGLALEHRAAFPEDTALLLHVLPPT